MHTVKCFHILLFNTNNSIKHQSFVYTQLKDQTVLFQTIQFSMSTKLNTMYHKQFNWILILCLHTVEFQTVLFQTIQFSIRFCCTQFEYQTGLLLGATSPGRVDLGVMAIKWVNCIPQGTSITGASPLACFVKYIRTLVRRVLPSAEMYPVFYSPSWLGKLMCM